MAAQSLIIPLRRAAVLCLVAGYVDAYGYLALGAVFTANMTGNTVLLGIAGAQLHWARFTTFTITLLAFFFGAVAASAVIRSVGKRPLVLLTVAILLVAAPALNQHQRSELLILTFAMGMQGAALGRFGNVNLNTVVVTGTILRFADELTARLFSAVGTAPKPPPGSVAIPLAGWLIYGVGAAIGTWFLALVAYPLLAPAALLVIIAADVARTEMVSS
jgi:uncharacterized membrane protein YoaK (UPF0700 family)